MLVIEHLTLMDTWQFLLFHSWLNSHDCEIGHG